jgi:hypothetical protein
MVPNFLIRGACIVTVERERGEWYRGRESVFGGRKRERVGQWGVSVVAEGRECDEREKYKRN